MTEPKVAAVAQKLDQTLAKLQESKDPDTRKNLLSEMRILIAELNELVFAPLPRPPDSK